MNSQTNLNSKVLFSICFILISNLLSAQKIEVKEKNHKQTASITNELLARITAVEDRLEIINLLAGAAFSSDVASELYWKKMFTNDATFDLGAPKPDKGQDEILKIINAPEQKQAIEAGLSHLAMLPHITLNGNTAVATRYLLIVMPDTTASHVNLPGKGISPGFSIYQLTVNQWQLLRTKEGWKVTQRTVKPISSADSRRIIKQSVEN